MCDRKLPVLESENQNAPNSSQKFQFPLICDDCRDPQNPLAKFANNVQYCITKNANSKPNKKKKRKSIDEIEDYSKCKLQRLPDYHSPEFQGLCENDLNKFELEETSFSDCEELLKDCNQFNCQQLCVQPHYLTFHIKNEPSPDPYDPISVDETYPELAAYIKQILSNNRTTNKLFGISFEPCTSPTIIKPKKNPYEILIPTVIENLLNKLVSSYSLSPSDLQKFSTFLNIASRLGIKDLNAYFKLLRKRGVVLADIIDGFQTQFWQLKTPNMTGKELKSFLKNVKRAALYKDPFQEQERKFEANRQLAKNLEIALAEAEQWAKDVGKKYRRPEYKTEFRTDLKDSPGKYVYRPDAKPLAPILSKPSKKDIRKGDLTTQQQQEQLDFVGKDGKGGKGRKGEVGEIGGIEGKGGKVDPFSKTLVIRKETDPKFQLKRYETEKDLGPSSQKSNLKRDQYGKGGKDSTRDQYGKDGKDGKDSARDQYPKDGKGSARDQYAKNGKDSARDQYGKDADRDQYGKYGKDSSSITKAEQAGLLDTSTKRDGTKSSDKVGMQNEPISSQDTSKMKGQSGDLKKQSSRKGDDIDSSARGQSQKEGLRKKDNIGSSISEAQMGKDGSKKKDNVGGSQKEGRSSRDSSKKRESDESKKKESAVSHTPWSDLQKAHATAGDALGTTKTGKEQQQEALKKDGTKKGPGATKDYSLQKGQQGKQDPTSAQVSSSAKKNDESKIQTQSPTDKKDESSRKGNFSIEPGTSTDQSGTPQIFKDGTIRSQDGQKSGSSEDDKNKRRTDRLEDSLRKKGRETKIQSQLKELRPYNQHDFKAHTDLNKDINKDLNKDLKLMERLDSYTGDTISAKSLRFQPEREFRLRLAAAMSAAQKYADKTLFIPDVIGPDDQHRGTKRFTNELLYESDGKLPLISAKSTVYNDTWQLLERYSFVHSGAHHPGYYEPWDVEYPWSDLQDLIYYMQSFYVKRLPDPNFSFRRGMEYYQALFRREQEEAAKNVPAQSSKHNKPTKK